jgi:hypothetical protein
MINLIKVVCIQNTFSGVSLTLNKVYDAELAGQFYITINNGIRDNLFKDHYRISNNSEILGLFHKDNFMLYNDWLALNRENHIKSIIDD